jgi:hypothetical protein
METIYEKIERACRLNPSSKKRNDDLNLVKNGEMAPSDFIKNWEDTFDNLTKTDLTCARLELLLNVNINAIMFIARIRRRMKHSQKKKNKISKKIEKNEYIPNHVKYFHDSLRK